MSMTIKEAIAELDYEAEHLNVMIGRHMLQIATLETEMKEYEDRLKFIKLKRADLVKGR